MEHFTFNMKYVCTTRLTPALNYTYPGHVHIPDVEGITDSVVNSVRELKNKQKQNKTKQNKIFIAVVKMSFCYTPTHSLHTQTNKQK